MGKLDEFEQMVVATGMFNDVQGLVAIHLLRSYRRTVLRVVRQNQRFTFDPHAGMANADNKGEWLLREDLLAALMPKKGTR